MRNDLTYISSVMSKPVVTAKGEARLSVIIAEMLKSRVGTIVIVDSNNIPRGIITERELLRDISVNNRVGVQLLARHLMSSGFVRLLPETAVERAADLMIMEGVRLLVTRKNGLLLGIVTATDLLYHFSKVAKDIPIESDFARDVKTLDVSKSFLDAVKLMNEKRIGSVVVTERELEFGIITERDILKVLSKGRRKEFDAVHLEDVATRPLISAPYGITAREAAQVMEANKIKRLVLFKGEKMAGIITARDLVAAYVRSFRVPALKKVERKEEALEESVPSGISPFTVRT
jgi:CBS domain-containing protein